MKIAYGVHGYGRGHATRAFPILEHLCSEYEVKIFAGGDAYGILADQFDVIRIPCLSFDKKGTRKSVLRTLTKNASNIADLILRGVGYQIVRESLEQLQPNVVISDSEGWTGRAAFDLNIPRIAFDHHGIFTHCTPSMSKLDKLRLTGDNIIYKQLIPKPDRILASSFYSAPCKHDRVSVVPAILRNEVYGHESTEGDHLVAYFSKGLAALSHNVVDALTSLPYDVRMYGTHDKGSYKNIQFKKIGRKFLKDLASCRAVISTAGNQLVGECMYYKKPMLVMPEDSVDQRTNARHVDIMGIGIATTFEAFDKATVAHFLSRLDYYKAKASHHEADGREEAIEILDLWIKELGLPFTN